MLFKQATFVYISILSTEKNFCFQKNFESWEIFFESLEKIFETFKILWGAGKKGTRCLCEDCEMPGKR